MTSTPQQLFTPDPGTITDFTGKRPADIYNESVMPTVNSFLDLLGDDPGGLDEARKRRQQQAAVDASLLDEAPQEQNFVDQMLARKRGEEPVLPVDNDLYVTPTVDYNSAESNAPGSAPTKTEFKGGMKIKLANYGYDSDTSPDYNSNVLRIGHANNKLKDGVSAALTKSLAKRLGLKTGDYFEAVTAEGKVLKRRYDDTVPSVYRGKKLPETVDLYERSGKNNFGGTVVDIRPIR